MHLQETVKWGQLRSRRRGLRYSAPCIIFQKAKDAIRALQYQQKAPMRFIGMYVESIGRNCPMRKETKMEANDMKAIREALEQIAKLMDRILARTELDDEIHRIALEAQNAADGALLLSPRNCDVGSAEEQTERFIDYCSRCEKSKMDIELIRDRSKCIVLWAHMPYEAQEGGAK